MVGYHPEHADAREGDRQHREVDAEVDQPRGQTATERWVGAVFDRHRGNRRGSVCGGFRLGNEMEVGRRFAALRWTAGLRLGTDVVDRARLVLGTERKIEKRQLFLGSLVPMLAHSFRSGRYFTKIR
ncbi:MAG: hypothetical protein HC897_14865 [Thermoanaerobaculia bacterium]|nr:hypothetical protein [Thermoanaerobaculia bacterium]